MRNNKLDEYQECFVEHQTEQFILNSCEQITVNINNKFNIQLPPNELRTARRPENMAPRTFYLERPFYLLNKAINQSCTELTAEIDNTKLKLKIVNKGNLSLEQYFMKKKFKCIYNRLQNCKADSKSFQGRLKSIDALTDYNWKSFKQLQEQKHRFDKWEDVIDSDFQSGNICRAYVNTEQQKQYYLLIENDLNTYGYNNWFFYRLKNRQKGRRRFTIVNFIKKTSFFSQGMLISIFSTNKNKYEGARWFKGGERVTFGSINLPRNHHASQNYSSLSFEFDFEYQDDEVYFALNQPYTYSRLITYVESIKIAPKKISLQVKNIGYSIANNILPSLKFSKPQSENTEIILILARQHPCQTVGSFIAEQIMNFLLQSNKIGQCLLESYDFVVVPMVNPDGVIHGSSRCNMAGLDLNRQWGDYIIKELTPQTLKIKQHIYNITRNQKIKYMIDLHGHGKKLNSFFFSCKDNEKQQIKLLSVIMKKLEPRFNYADCTYGISKDKENTIRSTINNMGIMFSYTLETSLYGWKDQNGQVRHFNEDDYRELAKSLMQSIFLMEGDPTDTMREVGYTKEGIINEMKPYVERNTKEAAQNYDENEIMSDSDPEGDKLELKQLMGKCQNKLLKKKLQQYNKKTKKPKEKKQKKLNSDSRCFSNKNIRSTCASALGVKAKLSITNTGFFNKDLSLKADVKNSQKKISLSDKWKERRKEIQKKKVLVQRQFEQKQFLQDSPDRDSSRLEPKNRIRTEPSKVIRPFRAHLPHSAFLKAQASRVKHPNHRMKSQFKQIQSFQPPTQEELLDSEARKSALEQKYKQLKKSSLGVLLTDTLSILKINPSQKQKHQQSEAREASRLSVRLKKEHLATEPNLHANEKIMPAEEPLSPDKETRRIKKFKQFMNGSSNKRKASHLNSVFYYFPIL